MATTQYKDNASNIHEFQQEAGDAGGSERRPVAGMPAAVRSQLASMAASLSTLAGVVFGGVFRVVIEAGTAVIGKLGPNAGVNIGTVDVASGTFAVTGALPAGGNHIGAVAIDTSLPAGNANIGDVDVASLPALLQLPATLGDKPSAASLSVVMATDHSARPVSITTQLPPGTNNIGDVDIASMPPLPAGTNAIGKLAANPTVNIGTVDVVQLPLSLGQRNMGTSLPVVLPSDQSPVTVRSAGTPLLVTDGGSPLQVTGLVTVGNSLVVNLGTSLPAGNANIGDVDIASSLPAGTNAIGKLAPNAGVNIGTVDILPPNGVMPVTVTNTVSTAFTGPLPAGNANIGDVDVATLPSIGQLPATLGVKTAAASMSVALASDQVAVPTKTEAFADYDTAAATQNVSLRGIALPASGGAVAGGTLTAPLRVDPTGATAQPISGAVTVSTWLGSSLPTVGQKPASSSVPVVLASDATVAVTDGNGSLTVDGVVSLSAGAATIGGVTLAAPIPAGNNNIGDVDIATLPALPQLPASVGAKTSAASLSVVIATDQTSQGVTVTAPIPAGNNNIGDVDIATLPAIGQLPATLGAKAAAASMSVVLATDQGTHPVSLSASLPAGNNNIGDIDIASMPPLPAGTNNIGDVDILSLPALPQLPATIGQKAKTTSLGVAIASDQVVPVSSAQLPATLGQKGQVDSLPVVLASDTQVVVFPRVGKFAFNTVVAASISAVTLAAGNSARVGLTIANNKTSTSTLYLKVGTGASLTSWSALVEPGGYWEMPSNFYDGEVTGIWSTAVGDAHVTETGTNVPPE